MVSNGVAIGADPDDTLELSVWVFPAYLTQPKYAIDVTPTLHVVPDPDSAGPDPSPWLRFAVTLPDGRTFDGLSAVEFNALPDRSFPVCLDTSAGGPGGCGYVLEIAVTLDPGAPFTIRDAKPNIRVAFDGMTTWK
jgi:hypothetical protein